jgi:hypothetical protein
MKITNKHIAIVAILLWALVGCIQKTERSLLFKCVGEDQGHSDLGDEKPLKMAKNLFIGENYAEINGAKYKICKDSKTIVNFATDCDKGNKLRESYDFFMANHHLSGKDFKHSGGQADSWSSYWGDCEPVENKNK